MVLVDWRERRIFGWVQVSSENASALCPDLLRYEQIGEADSLRGHVVRAFFWLLRWWP